MANNNPGYLDDELREFLPKYCWTKEEKLKLLDAMKQIPSSEKKYKRKAALLIGTKTEK